MSKREDTRHGKFIYFLPIFEVADTFFRVAPLVPKLRVVAVDVSVGGKGTESLISHYGISSTPVIALWQDGFPRYRLYDDYARLDTLLRALRSHTDLSLSTAAPTTVEQTKNDETERGENGGHDNTTGGDAAHERQQQPSHGVQSERGQGGGVEEDTETTDAKVTTDEPEKSAGGDGSVSQHQRQSPWREPSRDEFLAQFHYLKEHLGFDWYLLAAIVTCAVNCLYFVLSSNKCRAVLRRHFPHHFAVFLH